MSRSAHNTITAHIVDDGHKIRLKLLAKKMLEAVEIRDALEARAVTLHMKDHPGREWMEDFQSESPESQESTIDLSPQAIAEYYDRSMGEKADGKEGDNTIQEEDLIDLKLRRYGVYLIHWHFLMHIILAGSETKFSIAWNGYWSPKLS